MVLRVFSAEESVQAELSQQRQELQSFAGQARSGRALGALQPTQIGKAKVAYPTIKRLLIHIFALSTFKVYSDAMKYCD